MNFTLKSLITEIVKSPLLHAKWLNTLSFMENCGARKISSCEHPTLVKEEMLKHAAEEFRHAHYLKGQIAKISPILFKDYSPYFLLGGIQTVHYLNGLDLKTSRYLTKEKKLSKKEVREAAYLLVTYAIELRAEALYPIYDEVLHDQGSHVRVKSILLEEKEHLKEMEEGLSQLPFGKEYAQQVCSFEQEIYHKWLQAIYSSTGIVLSNTSFVQ